MKSNIEEKESLTLKRRLQVIGIMLKTSWRIRKSSVIGYFIGAGLEIGGTLGSIYASAKLGGLLVDYISTNQTDGIWFWLVADIVAIIFIGLGFLVMSYFNRLLYFAYSRYTTLSFMQKMCEIDINDFYDTSLRNRLNKVGGSYTWQISNLSEATLSLLYAIARFIAITIIVAQITWWIVPLIAVFLIPSLIGESKQAKMQWFVWDSKGDTRHIFWGLENMVKRPKNQFEIRVSQATKFITSTVDRMNQTFYSEQEHRYKQAQKFLVPTKVLEVAGPAIGSVVLVLQFLERQISFERYLFLTGALLRVGGALNTVFSTLTRMEDSLQFADDYFRLLERKPTIVDKPNAIQLKTQQTPTIEFKNVTFRYPGKKRTILKNFSLTIQPGEHVALVGENGAGKSTLIKLLLRFYRPSEGKILINGHDLQDIAINSWYTQLATLMQEFNTYPLSIAENIEIGRSDKAADKELLEKAADFGNIKPIIKQYKYGWDTVLDASFKKGVEPSGGQWQRVALARAFYRQANVLILDEPTSAIDARAEYDIFNNIFAHYQKKTAIIVSHRFSTVRRADRIVVLDEGKIIEQGTHSELINQNGVYHDLFTKQAEGYKD